jgi:hypothetical protein
MQMNDRTRQIVDLILKAPELIEAWGGDPKLLAAKVGLSDKGLLLLDASRNLIENYMNRAPSPGVEYGGAVPSPIQVHSRSKVSLSEAGTIPVVGVVGLASLAGMLTAASVVALVAINKE